MAAIYNPGSLSRPWACIPSNGSWVQPPGWTGDPSPAAGKNLPPGWRWGASVDLYGYPG